MNHSWSLYSGSVYMEQARGTKLYLCDNCGLYKQIVSEKYDSFKQYLKSYGKNTVYFGSVITQHYTVVEPSCAEIIMKQIME